MKPASISLQGFTGDRFHSQTYAHSRTVISIAVTYGFEVDYNPCEKTSPRKKKRETTNQCTLYYYYTKIRSTGQIGTEHTTTIYR